MFLVFSEHGISSLIDIIFHWRKPSLFLSILILYLVLKSTIWSLKWTWWAFFSNKQETEACSVCQVNIQASCEESSFSWGGRSLFPSLLSWLRGILYLLRTYLIIIYTCKLYTILCLIVYFVNSIFINIMRYKLSMKFLMYLANWNCCLEIFLNFQR